MLYSSRLVEQLHAGLEKKNIHPDQTLHLARDMRRLQLDLDIACSTLCNMEACFAADVRCCPHAQICACLTSHALDPCAHGSVLSVTHSHSSSACPQTDSVHTQEYGDYGSDLDTESEDDTPDDTLFVTRAEAVVAAAVIMDPFLPEGVAVGYEVGHPFFADTA